MPCRGGVDPLTEAQVRKHLTSLEEGWEVHQMKLVKLWKFRNFAEAMAFVNRVAAVSEEQKHHPDIEICYNKVRILLWTHAIGGLSENDFILAAKTDLC